MTCEFRKSGPASALAMFEAERDGLEELRAAGEIRVPEVFDCGIEDGQSFIVLEHLDIGPASAACERRLGEALARLHGHTQDGFGWYRDNTIGPTPQRNDTDDDWTRFFRERRLEFQLDLAAANGFELGAGAERLPQLLRRILRDHRPAASLLHGDLWAGNRGCVDGEPVIFDPAVYYGDRETDIAMTLLFGGFGKAFYDAYEAAWPLPDGHATRTKLYQLYHVLNHLNLFGTSYLDQATRLIDELLRSAG